MATPSPAAASFPVLPPGQFIEFLTGLDLPVTSPGSSVSLTGSLANPLSGPLTSVNVSFQFYAFNGFPGNDTGPMPAGSAPTFVAPTGPGAVDWVDAPSLSPGESVPIQLSIDVPSGASPGDYAVRTALDFVLNGTTYLLESRGYFSYSEWTNATVSPGGGSTLNVSRLGVSGVLPETALSVQTNPIPIALYVLLGGALALAAVGGYYASRRGPGSRSGAR
ncbi:MAG TPA: NEW3 domain-containing protein [Thermoplasmata archaeon]|nr:NEW3 domain-containing protein [Thermoplasmata archaeon]